MTQVRGVCFDLGGVLIRIHHDWHGAVLAAGFEPKHALGPLGGFEEFELYQDGKIGLEEYLPALKAHVGVGSDQDALAVHMAILRDEYPGVTGVIEDLLASGLVCGCLSNTSASHWATFFDGRRFSFGPLLGPRIGSHIVHASKPDPKIYEAFEKESGLRLEQIIYFDDGNANVEAAKSRGWSAFLIDPKRDTDAQMREHLGPLL